MRQRITPFCVRRRRASRPWWCPHRVRRGSRVARPATAARRRAARVRRRSAAARRAAAAYSH
ncbi:MAG: hypothetical protein ACXV3C_12175, partial [Actinomycetes bacterium]